jgi:hypothetical protein
MKTCVKERIVSIYLGQATRWKWMVSFMPWRLHPWEKGPWYLFYRMLGWTLWSNEKSLAPAGNRTPVVQPLAHRTPVSPDKIINRQSYTFSKLWRNTMKLLMSRMLMLWDGWVHPDHKKASVLQTLFVINKITIMMVLLLAYCCIPVSTGHVPSRRLCTAWPSRLVQRRQVVEASAKEVIHVIIFTACCGLCYVTSAS